MIVTAWSNGSSSYGVKISVSDRNLYFKKDWKTVKVELEGPDRKVIEVNVAKPSFWRPSCGELISKEIKRWFEENNLLTWLPRCPPKLSLIPISNGYFLLAKNNQHHLLQEKKIVYDKPFDSVAQNDWDAVSREWQAPRG